ncbi:MAG: hypothetical protein JNJ77_15040 [Planctomycetia bacterium]|nr:hypothetical protein [Planctomycetia bacterium]
MQRRSFLLAGFCFVSGCVWPEIMDNVAWKQQLKQPFSTLNPEDESVAQLDVATMTWRRDQPILKNDGMWAELDEQFIPLETRQQLARHGLRMGLMRTAGGSRLQAALANPEYARQAIEQNKEIIRHQFIIEDKYVEPPKASPICMVEARRVMNRQDQELTWPVGPRGIQANLLVPDAEKEYTARELSQIELYFDMQLQKTTDGLTRVRLVPAVKSALVPKASSNVFLESLKLNNTVNKFNQRYEKLVVETTLSQEQYLVITASQAVQHEGKAETWGDLAFVQYPTDQQVVLVMRGASVLPHRIPTAPKKGNAWPLAWQAQTAATK